jgi:hypothetical protein
VQQQQRHSLQSWPKQGGQSSAACWTWRNIRLSASSMLHGINNSRSTSWFATTLSSRDPKNSPHVSML